MNIILFSFFSYLFGSINGAQILHHFFRGRYPKHVSHVGTKNLGAQNVWMSISKRSGFLVFIIDFLKGFIAIFAARTLGFEGASLIFFGTFVVIGHNWPIFFHFRGGRGFAALLGIFYAFNFYVAVVASFISLIFGLIRLSGITPFVFLVVGGYMLFSEFGNPILYALGFMAAGLYAKRVYAEWDSLQNSKNKFSVLKNLLIYDRATSNPPSLKEIFS